ncbi:MAG: ATP-binding protein [Gemmatimonadota bacterium]
MRARLFLSLAGLAVLALLLYAVLDGTGVPGAAAIDLIFIVILAAAGARLLNQPFQRAAPFAAALSRGERPPRLPETASGEAGDLYRALNRLAEAHRLSHELRGAERTETELLLQEMGEGVLAISPAGNVVRVNAELRSVIGANEPIEGRAVATIFRNPELVNFLAPAAVPEGGVEGEFEVYGRTMLVAARRLPTGGVVAVFADLTELRRLDTVRTEFVANASHELKTPLTAIRGYSETLTDPDVPQDARVRFAGKIVDHAERMTAIVDDLLTLARLEEPGRTIRQQRIALLPLADGIAGKARERAEAAGIALSVDVDPADLDVVADPEGLRQVLENLIDNAIRHSGATAVRVRAGRLPSGEIKLSVEDNGRGIPEANLERVFERFYRVDASRSRATGGTGLGLSIVKHWTEAMGGRAWIESILAQGTRVYVSLPVTRPETC